MKINVSEILSEKSGFVSPLVIEENISVYEKDIYLAGNGQVLRTDKGVWVSAKIQTEVEIVCSRCLKSFSYRIILDLEEEVVHAERLDKRQSNFEGGEEYLDVVLIDSNNILDMSNIVMQYIDINMPINTNCDVQCKGLCVECGINLNINKCICGGNSTDNGWNILATTRIIDSKEEM